MNKLPIHSLHAGFWTSTAYCESVIRPTPCSQQMRQQNAWHSRQALLSAVHCNSGDSVMCGLYECCLSYALHIVISESMHVLKLCYACTLATSI